jgi:hypothetical protein
VLVSCGCDLFTGVCTCVLYTVFSYALFLYVHITSFYFLHVNQQEYLCDSLRLIPVCVSKLLLTSFSAPLTTSYHHAWGNQY